MEPLGSPIKHAQGASGCRSARSVPRRSRERDRERERREGVAQRGQRVTVVRKARHCVVVTARVGLAGSLESRTRTPSGAGATSTQSPPLGL